GQLRARIDAGPAIGAARPRDAGGARGDYRERSGGAKAAVRTTIRNFAREPLRQPRQSKFDRPERLGAVAPGAGPRDRAKPGRCGAQGVASKTVSYSARAGEKR